MDIETLQAARQSLNVDEYVDIDPLLFVEMILLVLAVVKYKQIVRFLRKHAPLSYGQLTILAPIVAGLHPLVTEFKLHYDKKTTLGLGAASIMLYVSVVIVQFLLSIEYCGCCRRKPSPEKKKKKHRKKGTTIASVPPASELNNKHGANDATQG